MPFCYILYSRNLDSFYIGSTHSALELRIQKHREGFYFKSYTRKAHDWELYLSIKCDSYSQARNVETQIKKMKSKTYITNLRKYPEIIRKLLLKSNSR